MFRTILNCDVSCRVPWRSPISLASVSWSCICCGLRCRLTVSLFEREPQMSSGVLCVIHTCVMAAVRAFPRGLLMMTRPSKGCMSGDVRRVDGLGVDDVVGVGFENLIFLTEMIPPMSKRRKYRLRFEGNLLYGGTVEYRERTVWKMRYPR